LPVLTADFAASFYTGLGTEVAPRSTPVIVAAVDQSALSTVVAAHAADAALEAGGIVVLMHGVFPLISSVANLCGLGCEATWGVVATRCHVMDDEAMHAEGHEVTRRAAQVLVKAGVEYMVDHRLLRQHATAWARRRVLANLVAAVAAEYAASAVVVGARPGAGGDRSVLAEVRRRTPVRVIAASADSAS
jgi:hypothetical protein